MQYSKTGVLFIPMCIIYSCLQHNSLFLTPTVQKGKKLVRRIVYSTLYGQTDNFAIFLFVKGGLQYMLSNAYNLQITEELSYHKLNIIKGIMTP